MIIRAKSLKTNPLFWIGVAALVYGGFLFLATGISIKALIALGAGVWLLFQTGAPMLGGKIKDGIINWVKGVVADMMSNPVETAVMVMESGPAPMDEPAKETVRAPAVVKTSDFTEAFKDDDFDAIAHLAYQAKKSKNDAAVEQLRAVHNEFFNISLNRIEKDEDKPAV